MKKITFKNFVGGKFLKDEYGIEMSELSGSGVYKIFVGSRGEVEEVVKVSDDNSFDLRDVEEIVEELVVMYGDDDMDDIEMMIEEGMICSMKDDRDDCEMYWEGFNEEEGNCFVWVKL